jgi:bifunctional DNase/RNase
MEKVQLVVLGLSASPASNNAYALILKEIEGNRRLPIIIGAFEAQAIALEMEGVIPPRPMTHDLIKSLIDTFASPLSEVFINELRDGTFYAKLVFESSGHEIDARPSDAIAIAVRTGVPIYVNVEILEETGLMPQEDEGDPMAMEDGDEDMDFMKESQEPNQPAKPKTRVEQLQDDLDQAVDEEDYEKAAKIRDELKRLLESS